MVIDNSSAWRMDPDVPLVIPEINMEACKGKKLIANPNCTTAIALMALYPLHREFGVKKCIVSTYQASAGAEALGGQSLGHVPPRSREQEDAERVYGASVDQELLPGVPGASGVGQLS